MAASPKVSKLLEPVSLGALRLRNRIIMAPLTRCRATPQSYTANPRMVQYYAERAADAGMVITEATLVSEQGRGFPNTPGCYNAEQVQAWRTVTDAVHKKGGLIVLQAWHQGRNASEQLSGVTPVGPDAEPFLNMMGQKTVGHKALTLEEIPGIVAQYKAAAVHAKEAGFDGYEVHGANGYLPNQFLESARTDAYGGSVANRTRFLLEVVHAAASVFGADRVGVRLSPPSHFNDVGKDADPVGLYSHVVTELDKLGLAYVHLCEPRDWGFGPSVGIDATLTSAFFRPLARNTPILSASGHTAVTAEETVVKGEADACVFGRHFISNPDLVAKLAGGLPLTPYDRDTFYGDGKEKDGYNSYPATAGSFYAQ